MAIGPTDRTTMAGRLPGTRPQAGVQTTPAAPRGTAAPGLRQPVARPVTGAPDAMPLTAAIARTTSAPTANPDVAANAVSPRARMMKKGGLVRKDKKNPYSKR